ncbi:larval cuticle protein LCP-17-like [Arctopsyche grandis]|uniref:larval cuticle protein LCP-17-like n=1 Tax=Arctopsyche grandis TaxID=121162 RepID=UPI00406D9F2A
MKLLTFLLVISTAIVLVSSKPAPPAPPPPQIVKSSFDLDPSGSYNFGFETENGIVKDEVGSVKAIKNEKGMDEPAVVVKGSYSYYDPDGNQIVLTYIADENGFQPQGAHLPTL